MLGKKVVLVAFLVAGSAVLGGEAVEPRGDASGSGNIRNPHPAFVIRVEVDKPDRVYFEGETLEARIKSSRDGYLFLFNYRPDGTVWCIFPNSFQRDNAIRAGEEIVVPAPEAPFVFQICPPLGQEVLQAIVSVKPVEPQQLGVFSLTEAQSTQLLPDRVKVICPAEKPQEWAEHQIKIETRPKTQKKPQEHKPRRISLLIGVGRFTDSHIRQLRSPANDVDRMEKILREEGRFDEILVLKDEEATYAAIRKAICELLPSKAAPGDEVILYFSGHGGRCADDNGDEADGLDEYLVPHDGQYVEPWQDPKALRDTMILDDTFARWVQELDGRRLVVVIDACYSGGHSQFEKGLPILTKTPIRFDFADDIREELSRVKNLGQEVILFASCSAQEIAVECREKPLSVMTACLADYIEQTPAPVTLRQAAEHTAEAVRDYLQKHYQGLTQTPYLVGEEAAEQFCVKPLAF